MTFRTLVVRSCLALTAAALLGGTAIAAGSLEARRAPGYPDVHRADVGSLDLRRPDGDASHRGGPSDDRVAMDIDLSRPGTPTIAVEGGGDAASAKDARRKGAAFLVGIQKADGGWGAGNWGQPDDTAPSDVATSAMVVLALHRDSDGTELHRAAIEKGVRFVLAAIESAPRDSARVTTPEGTQPQRKLGLLVDTHMAALMLTEMGGHLGNELDVAMDRGLGQVIAKVQLAQRADGSFDGEGWAPVLSNSIAATSLMRAADQGVAVDETVLKKSGDYQAARVSAGGGVDTSTGAGVDLYAVAGALRTNSMNKDRATGEGKAAAEQASAASMGRVSRDADALMSGFGSVGGEEMLGYMMISDSLVEEDKAHFSRWDGKVGAYLAGIQNADGSWVGHHCITGRTFTTAAAVMTLGAGDWAKRQASRADAKAANKG